MNNLKKIKIAVAPGSSCGGCDVALVNLNEKLLDITNYADIVFWPTALDFKIEDLEQVNEIDIGIFVGALRHEDHVKLAKLLREKSKIIVALGSCACYGGIFSLANLFEKKDLLETVYQKTITTENSNGKMPTESIKMGNIDISLPKLTNWCLPLKNLIDVDIYAPGCPPGERVLEKLYNIIIDFVKNGTVPDKGIALEPLKTLCDICPRKKPEKIVIRKFKRIHEVKLDPELCFLAQGVICLGPISIAGCDANCIKANIPCRGCLGPNQDIHDVAAKFISAIASLVQIDKEKELEEEEIVNLIEEIVDPIGTFHRFTFGSGIFNKKQEDVME